jgi:hypothetical protein
MITRHLTTSQYGPFWPIDTTTAMVPTQKHQLKQLSIVKIDSSLYTLWANS